MTGPDAAHEQHAHADHPVPATIVALVIVAIFTGIFALTQAGVITTAVAVATVIMVAWGLVAIWALDRD